MDAHGEIGRIAKNDHQDIRVFVSLYRNRPFVQVQTLPTGASEPEDPGRPRILSLSPETVQALLPLLAKARAAAVRLGDDEERP